MLDAGGEGTRSRRRGATPATAQGTVAYTSWPVHPASNAEVVEAEALLASQELHVFAVRRRELPGRGDDEVVNVVAGAAWLGRRARGAVREPPGWRAGDEGRCAARRASRAPRHAAGGSRRRARSRRPLGHVGPPGAPGAASEAGRRPDCRWRSPGGRLRPSRCPLVRGGNRPCPVARDGAPLGGQLRQRVSTQSRTASVAPTFTIGS